MTMPFRCRRAGLALLALIGAGCASQVPPSGGPPDTEPPEIIATVPSEGELNFRGEEFEVRFSEYVDRRSFQESVFLSPSAGTLRFEWSGTEVRIVPSDTLRGGTTFILTVGTDLKDTRNNTLTKSFTLAFSTGGVIDSCAVSGRVYDTSPGGVMVYAYGVPEGRPDTLNPATARPDYLSQTGADGTFRLAHLKSGRYRVIAVRDVFKNLLYNVQTDMVGMPAGDVVLTAESREVTGLSIRLTVEDTLRPYVTTAKAVDRGLVTVRFNERPDRRRLRETVSVEDTATGEPLEVLDFSPVDTAGREFQLATSPQDSGKGYRLVLGDLADQAGNRADSAGRTTTFAGGGGGDTLAPVLTFGVRGDSTTGIAPRTRLTFSFSRAVDTAAAGRGFSLSAGDTARVEGTLRWDGSMLARFEPVSLPVPGIWYTATFGAGSLCDVHGKAVTDSALSRHFRITEEKFLGSIEGSVVLRDTTVRAALLRVIARNVTDRPGDGIMVGTDAAGNFIVDQIPGGLYVVSAFVDRNGNGVYDYGSPYPVRYAEEFFVYPDTVKIRPGWPVGGVRIGPGR